jgi:hypothetical protein
MVGPIGLTLTKQEVCRVFEKLHKEPKLDFFFQDNLFRGIFKKIEMDPFLSKSKFVVVVAIIFFLLPFICRIIVGYFLKRHLC